VRTVGFGEIMAKTFGIWQKACPFSCKSVNTYIVELLHKNTAPDSLQFPAPVPVLCPSFSCPVHSNQRPFAYVTISQTQQEYKDHGLARAHASTTYLCRNLTAPCITVDPVLVVSNCCRSRCLVFCAPAATTKIKTVCFVTWRVAYGLFRRVPGSFGWC
jgi:hypothetical protein